MLSRWIRRSDRHAPRRAAAPVDAASTELCEPECATACPLADCARGHQAVVVRVDCDAADACRLRALGVYEGARVDVVDSRNGLLLQVRGSRIALGAAVAAAIAVIPAT